LSPPFLRELRNFLYYATVMTPELAGLDFFPLSSGVAFAFPSDFFPALLCFPVGVLVAFMTLSTTAACLAPLAFLVTLALLPPLTFGPLPAPVSVVFFLVPPRETVLVFPSLSDQSPTELATIPWLTYPFPPTIGAIPTALAPAASVTCLCLRAWMVVLNSSSL